MLPFSIIAWLKFPSFNCKRRALLRDWVTHLLSFLHEIFKQNVLKICWNAEDLSTTDYTSLLFILQKNTFQPRNWNTFLGTEARLQCFLLPSAGNQALQRSDPPFLPVLNLRGFDSPLTLVPNSSSCLSACL